jgi:hypothetical protein
MFRSVFDQVNNDPVEYQNRHYIWAESEFWVWDPAEGQWKALPDIPEFLTLANGRAALLDPETGWHICNCPPIWVTRHGCGCGGL